MEWHIVTAAHKDTKRELHTVVISFQQAKRNNAKQAGTWDQEKNESDVRKH